MHPEGRLPERACYRLEFSVRREKPVADPANRSKLGYMVLKPKLRENIPGRGQQPFAADLVFGRSRVDEKNTMVSTEAESHGTSDRSTADHGDRSAWHEAVYFDPRSDTSNSFRAKASAAARRFSFPLDVTGRSPGLRKTTRSGRSVDCLRHRLRTFSSKTASVPS